MGKDGAGGTSGGNCCGERVRTRTVEKEKLVQDPKLLKKIHDLENEVILETGLREAAQKRADSLSEELRVLRFQKEIDDGLFFGLVERIKVANNLADTARNVIDTVYIELNPNEERALELLAKALEEYRKTK